MSVGCNAMKEALKWFGRRKKERKLVPQLLCVNFMCENKSLACDALNALRAFMKNS